jgi:hypothetical protein
MHIQVNSMNSPTRVLPYLLAFLIPGCQNHEASKPSADYYYLNPNKRLTTVGRVAIVELENDSSYPQMSADVTGSLFRALQKRQVFGLTIVRRDDPSWRSLQLDGDTTYSLDQILAIHETMKCDAILLGTITEFRPYPHMTVGLRLKLLDMRDGQLLWALEQVWDGADKAIEQRTKSYFKAQKGSGFAPLQEQLATVSPLEFIKFVSYEVAATL